jgi:phosphatidylserine/phosphatidylglycerophosphate/cardiolipin synthase-like enzyme
MPFSSRMSTAHSTRRPRFRRAIFLGIVGIWLATACWEANKPLPPGMHIASAWHSVPAKDVSFIADITSADAYGRAVSSQAIFDEVLKVVRSAHEFLVLDYHMFNSRRGELDATSTLLRPLSAELRDALIERRRALPGLKVLFITDAVNELYGAAPSADLRLLRAAGVDVITTDLDRLRDPNPLYSSAWRLAIDWWSPNPRGEGWLPSPLDDATDPLTFGAWAQLVNFKANQRKVLIGDDGRGGLVGIVGSANPHDAGGADSNVAARVMGPVLGSLLESELAVARFSGWQGGIEPPPKPAPAAQSLSEADTDDDFAAGKSARVGVLTEGAIHEALLERVNAAVRGDSVDIAMFYVADRGIVESLLAASRRGVSVRLILDPNKDAFGRATSGLPNQPAASELVSESKGAIHVRWYRTHGERFHTKLVMIYGTERLWLTLGSANLTRRSVGDYNLEANLAIEVARAAPLALQTLEYFETLWSNRASLGIEYTADFAAYADPAQSHYWLYRFMEGTGMSDF